MGGSPVGKVRVLIAEDEPTLRELLELYLETDSRIEVAGLAGSLAAAREAIREKAPDVILLDNNLGDGTALDLLQERGGNGGPPVLILTGNADPSVGRNLLAAGARGFMLKSHVEPGQLVRAIHIVATEGVFLPHGMPPVDER